MAGRGKVEQVVILNTKFDLEDRRVFFGRARLLPDRIVLKGLGYKKVVKLDEIEEIRWSTDLICLFLDNGEEVDMMIQSSALWKFELQSRCGLSDSSTQLVSAKTMEANSVEEKSEPAENIESVLDALCDESEPETLPKRESQYRVRSGFSGDRPSTIR